MLDKAILSKQKYIYYIYESGHPIHEVHVERFPVIYINSSYVYFKEHGKKMLSWAYLSNVKESLKSLIDQEVKHLDLSGRYFWNCEENFMEILNGIRKEHEKRILELKRDMVKSNLEEAKKQYNKAMEEYLKYTDGGTNVSEDYSQIRSGTEIWYVDFDESCVEHGVIQTVSFKDDKVDCFGVKWDDGDFDVYDGSGLGTYYFLNKKNADKKFVTGDVR